MPLQPEVLELDWLQHYEAVVAAISLLLDLPANIDKKHNVGWAKSECESTWNQKNGKQHKKIQVQR